MMLSFETADRETLLVEIARLNELVKNLEFQLFSFYNEKNADSAQELSTDYEKNLNVEVSK